MPGLPSITSGAEPVTHPPCSCRSTQISPGNPVACRISSAVSSVRRKGLLISRVSPAVAAQLAKRLTCCDPIRVSDGSGTRCSSGRELLSDWPCRIKYSSTAHRRWRVVVVSQAAFKQLRFKRCLQYRLSACRTTPRLRAMRGSSDPDAALCAVS